MVTEAERGPDRGSELQAPPHRLFLRSQVFRSPGTAAPAILRERRCTAIFPSEPSISAPTSSLLGLVLRRAWSDPSRGLSGVSCQQPVGGRSRAWRLEGPSARGLPSLGGFKLQAGSSCPRGSVLLRALPLEKPPLAPVLALPAWLAALGPPQPLGLEGGCPAPGTGPRLP